MAAKKTTHYPCTGWYMEYRQNGSDKFYHVMVSENGVCVLRWGRRGSAGQHSATTYRTYDEARDQGLKQVFAKKSKGYSQQVGDFQFMASVEALDYALRGNTTKLDGEWREALSNGAFDGAKTTVLKHYSDFAERVKELMDRAGSGDFDSTMDQFEQLEQVWEEINDKHAEVSAAFDIAKMTLAQKLLGV